MADTNEEDYYYFSEERVVDIFQPRFQEYTVQAKKESHLVQAFPQELMYQP